MLRTLMAHGVMAILLAAVAVPPTAAQNAHQGFWIGFGVGAGVTGGNNSQGGGAGYVRLGGTVAPQLLVGGEGIAWGRRDNGVNVSHANATGNILFYPSLSSEFFFKVGLGFASFTRSQTSGNTTTSTTDSGFGTTYGVGYDAKVGKIYVTPNVDALVQVINSSTRTVWLLTVGLTWH